MNYNELTLRYFTSTPRVGVLVCAGSSRGAAGGVDLGTWVQFDLEAVGGTLRDARYLVFGCPHTIAVSAWIVEQGLGGALSGALPESVEHLERRFDMPAAKRGRLLIIEDAWAAAVRAARQ